MYLTTVCTNKFWLTVSRVPLPSKGASESSSSVTATPIFQIKCIGRETGLRCYGGNRPRILPNEKKQGRLLTVLGKRVIRSIIGTL